MEENVSRSDAGTPAENGAPAAESTLAPAETAAMSPSKDEKMWATIVHLSALIALVGVPFGNIIGPLVVWIIMRGDRPFVDEHGKRAIDFQLSLTIWGFLIVGALTLVAFILTFFVIGIILWPVVAAAVFLFYAIGTIYAVVAAIQAGDGKLYRYPLSFHFLNGSKDETDQG